MPSLSVFCFLPAMVLLDAERLFAKKTYPCTECDYVATRTNNLRTHKEAKHNDQKYFCTLCTFKSSNQRALKIHTEDKHDPKTSAGQRQFSCDSCSFSAAHRSTLSRHRKTLHGEDRYCCDKCQYATSIKRNLDYHNNSQHLGRFYQCDECGFRTANKSNLQVHTDNKHNNLNATSWWRTWYSLIKHCCWW